MRALAAGRQTENSKNAEDGDHPRYGGVAQLGEHLPCTQGVRSSILLISTKRDKGKGSAELTNGLIAQVVRAHA